MRTEDHPAISDEATGSDLAHRFAAALAARDADGLRSLFGGELDFRGLTPGRVWEASTPDALVNNVILGAWFEPGDVIDQIEAVQAGQVGSRTRAGYRFGVTNASGSYTVEQQAFLDLTDGKITWLCVLCSGFIPITAAGPRPPAAVHPDGQTERRQS
jgi:hypothetical protein